MTSIQRCIVCREEADSEPGHGYYRATCSCSDGTWAYMYACREHFEDMKALHKAHLKYPELAEVYHRSSERTK